jgi:hypothetical protein
MTDESSKSLGRRSAPGGRAQTMTLQKPLNLVLRGFLRTPLISRGIGTKLLTLYLVGRKTGKRYAIPVAYTEHEGDLLIGTPFGWGHNLRTGEPIKIRYKGELRTVDVQVFTEEADVVENYAIMSRDNHNFATFNTIDLDEKGEPDPHDLQLAWAAGARAFRLTLR